MCKWTHQLTRAKSFCRPVGGIPKKKVQPPSPQHGLCSVKVTGTPWRTIPSNGHSISSQRPGHFWLWLDPFHYAILLRSTSTFHHIHCEHSSKSKGEAIFFTALSPPSLWNLPSPFWTIPFHTQTGDVTLNRAKQRLKYLLHPLSTSHPPGLLNHVNTLTFAYCCYRSPFFQVKLSCPPSSLDHETSLLLARPFLQVFFAQNLTNTLFFQLHTTQADNRLNPQPELFGSDLTLQLSLSVPMNEPLSLFFLVHLISEHSIWSRHFILPLVI